MVKATSLLMAGITFTGGLLLGFILHLPGASSPHSRHPRALTDPSFPIGEAYIHEGPAGPVAMGTDDVVVQGAPVISSRSLLYLSISPESDEGSLEGNIGSEDNDSKQSQLSGSQHARGLNHVERHFNAPQPGAREGQGHQGTSVVGRSSGKPYTSNLNSQQTNSSHVQGAPSSYKGISVAQYYNNKKRIINNPPPSVGQMTAYDKKQHLNQSTGGGALRPGQKSEQLSGPSEDQAQKGHEKGPLVTEAGKVTNLDEQKHSGASIGGPEETLNTGLKSDRPDAQVKEAEPAKMSVTVIDIAPGHTESSLESSNTTPRRSSVSPSTAAQSPPTRDLIAGDDRESLVDVKWHSQQVKPDPNYHMDTNGSSSSSSSSSSGRFGQQLLDLVSGIYWSPQLEDLTPRGFDDFQTAKWRHQAQAGRVKELREGCGRMQNRLVIFEDGTKMCARYRINTDQIQGEVYSYYLAQILGIQNVLPAVLTKADPTSSQWGGVISDIDSAQWSPNKLLVLTPWLGHLQPAYIPQELQVERPEVTSHSASLVSRNLDELTELVQWSDLIVLDYLTGNVDRMVNNMFNHQWNPNMMAAPTHNLERVGQAGPIVFLDNESGLLHSYRLLDKYSEYHEKLLRGLCVFRKSTVEQIKRLYKNGTIGQEIKERFQKEEPTLAKGLSFLPHHNLSVLSQRLAQVYRQILSCERLYADQTNS